MGHAFGNLYATSTGSFRGSDLLLKRHTGKFENASLREKAQFTGKFGLMHLLRDYPEGEDSGESRRRYLYTHFNPRTGELTKNPEDGEELLDKNERDRPVPIRAVLGLGSNWRLLGEDPSAEKSDMAVVGVPDNEPDIVSGELKRVGPRKVDRIAFESTLYMKAFFDRFNVANESHVDFALCYNPSDMAHVEGIREMREQLLTDKEIHPVMAEQLKKYGFGGMQSYTFQEIKDDPSLAKLISKGDAMLYDLESRSRKKAGAYLARIYNNGNNSRVEYLVEDFYPNKDGVPGGPGAVEAWNNENIKRGDSWRVNSHAGTIYVELERKGGYPISIPIGTLEMRNGDQVLGPAMCALILPTFLVKYQEVLGDVSHVIIPTDKDEAITASGGLILLKRVFGATIRPFVLAINERTREVESSGRDGIHAFWNAICERRPRSNGD